MQGNPQSGKPQQFLSVGGELPQVVPIGVNLSTAVIPSLLSGQALSAAKDRRWAQPEILRCAQDDRWRSERSFAALRMTDGREKQFFKKVNKL